jgi:hypothetical protein
VPEDFRRVLLEFSSEVSFSWFLPEDLAPPPDLRSVKYGGCEWGISCLQNVENLRREFIESGGAQRHEEGEYYRVWDEKLAFHPVANGDVLALDLRFAPSPVVYLSHDGGEEHGFVLGPSFTVFMDLWTQLGCPGPEGWVLEPFVSSPISGLQPRSPLGRQWLEWFSLRSME